VVNILNDFLCSSRTICNLEVFLNPLDQVVLENTLDELMENIRCEELVDISSREAVSKRL